MKSKKVRFPAIGQVGVVVKDIDKTMEYYTSKLGIGPWKVINVDRPEYKMKLAFTRMGPVELELISIVSGRRKTHSDFLEAGREGLHHIGFFLDGQEKDELMAGLKENGVEVIESGASNVFTGSSYAYLATDKVGGVIFELLHRPSEARPLETK